MTAGIASRVSLDGQVALVTGAGGGIGRAVCALLGEAGARVIGADRPGCVPPEGVAGDLSQPEGAAAAVAAAVDRHGRLDVLVHCAGITRDASLARMTDAQWREVMAANLDSSFYLLRAAAPALRAAEGGAIVLISSINADRGKAGQANYAASKAGVQALAKTAARELGKHRIRVNAVAPGWIETPMTAHLPDAVRQKAIDDAALGRLGQPEDIAGVVLFLCSGLGKHVTGQVIRVDGGQLIA